MNTNRLLLPSNLIHKTGSGWIGKFEACLSGLVSQSAFPDIGSTEEGSIAGEGDSKRERHASSTLVLSIHVQQSLSMLELLMAVPLNYEMLESSCFDCLY
ncbi:hypothetical protein VNO80_33075 [Phaseolus coccineus]|uniref:Uncharacterized protein n=1 Tax=Phaseolus coccineus TaxID=3886 RepID=A0AAN9KYL5_PHACN